MFYRLNKISPVFKRLFFGGNNLLSCRKQQNLRSISTSDFEEEEKELNDTEYSKISNEYLSLITESHRVIVIQPKVYHPNRRTNTTPELQLSESVALVNTLPYWYVVDQFCIRVASFQRQSVFGTGQIQNIKKRMNQSSNVTALFISTDTLWHIQILELKKIFDVEVFDRYSLVIQIFRNHAKSVEAKLQVGLAELPYIYKKMSEFNGRINLLEQKKMYLHAREAKLKAALEKVKQKRDIVRSKRKTRGIPTIAVVGYTNCGKTTLIKAITGDENLQPKNCLFATLDTTAYTGYLPCKMRVLYIDTIGFIQDIPQVLIEPFKVTLEDALVADLIVHVYDASHPDKDAQVDHVRKTLQSLTTDKTIIEVANKCDLIDPKQYPTDVLKISAFKSQGIEELCGAIEDIIVNQAGRSCIKVRVQSGSPASAWLYKEATVVDTNVDPVDNQFIFLDVIINDNQMYSFKRFLKYNHN